jgi:hypothetical protein
MKTSSIIFTLSSLMAIFAAAGLTATNQLPYLVILTTAVIGLITGGLIADDEAKQEQAQKEFSNRLNK